MHTSNLIAYAVPVFTFMILCEFIYGYFETKITIDLMILSKHWAWLDEQIPCPFKH